MDTSSQTTKIINIMYNIEEISFKNLLHTSSVGTFLDDSSKEIEIVLRKLPEYQFLRECHAYEDLGDQ